MTSPISRHRFTTSTRASPCPGGLFWTTPASLQPPDGVEVQFGAGKAHMTATNLKGQDFFNLPNGLFHVDAPADATTTFDIHWSGPVTTRGPVTTPGSSGKLVMSQATITWSAQNSLGFHFGVESIRAQPASSPSLVTSETECSAIS